MNKHQKEVLQSQLNNEKKTISELKQVYMQALKDCSNKISELSARADLEPQNIQSIIYQKQYQEAIKAQLEGVLADLRSKEYATVSDYLTRCYQEGYTGVMYDLMGQGIPLIMPIDQEQVTKAIQTDSKLSKTLYARMGEDINKLKTSVRTELSRGISNGSSWNEMAAKMAASFKNTPFNKAYNNSIRIARTEGHRIQNQSALDAQHKAKSKGADVVKQWDSTLDGATRDTHRKLDGQIREVDEDFEVDGMTASAPGMFGDPSEDCNCRCCLLQRARWSLDESELDTLKERAEYFGLDETKDFNDFKEKYLQASERVRSNAQKMNSDKILENNGKSGTIESYKVQKKPYTKVKVEDIPSMDENKFNKIKTRLEKNGISVIQDADGDAYLKFMGAEAMTLSDGSAIIFQSGRIPSASACFEEIIHTTQIRKNGVIQTTGDIKGTIEYLDREIEANEKLLKYKEVYMLTDKDVESIEENLNMYYRKRKEVIEDV